MANQELAKLTPEEARAFRAYQEQKQWVQNGPDEFAGGVEKQYGPARKQGIDALMLEQQPTRLAWRDDVLQRRYMVDEKGVIMTDQNGNRIKRSYKVV